MSKGKAVAVAMAALLLAVLLRLPAPPYSGRSRPALPWSEPEQLLPGPGAAAYGLGLIYGVEDPSTGSLSQRMPLSGILSALLFSKSPRSAWGVWRLLYAGLLFLLVAAMGALLGGRVAMLSAAAGLWAIAALLSDGTSYMHAFDALFIALVCAVLVWRARKPTLGRSAVLGAAMGLALLYRSPVAFFPPLLALFEWRFGPAMAWRERVKHAAALVLIPYLMLLPWIAFNAANLRTFAVFEDREAVPNIITGAVGQVYTWQGDWHWEDFPKRSFSGTFEAVGWAALYILKHPLPYLVGVCARLKYVFGMAPMLVALAFGALLFFRKRLAFQELGLFLGYYLLIHCTMTVQDGYFIPWWPPLAALAGAAPGALWARGNEAESPETRLASRGTLAAWGLGMCLGLYTLWIVGRCAVYALAAPLSSSRSFERAVNAHPDDAWLRGARGRKRLAAGYVAGAAVDLEAALSSGTGDSLAAPLHAWALMLLGRPETLLRLADPQPGPESAQVRILRAHGYLRLYGRLRARAELETAVAEGVPGIPYGVSGEGDVPHRIRRFSQDLVNLGFGWLAIVPEAERLALRQELEIATGNVVSRLTRGDGPGVAPAGTRAARQP